MKLPTVWTNSLIFGFNNRHIFSVPKLINLFSRLCSPAVHRHDNCVMTAPCPWVLVGPKRNKRISFCHKESKRQPLKLHPLSGRANAFYALVFSKDRRPALLFFFLLHRVILLQHTHALRLNTLYIPSFFQNNA